MAFNKPNKRRVFITTGGTVYHKLFTISQEKDYSIYCYWPNFHETKWVSLFDVGSNFQGKIVETPQNAPKLSMHGSGVVKFRGTDFSNRDPDRIKGNYLVDEHNKKIGMRHLFTAYLSKPYDTCDSSPYSRRPSDTLITGRKSGPFVLMFFAIPQQPIPLSINMTVSFDTSLCESVPPDFGYGLFSLAYHDIFWFAYRTKFMDHWPKYPHVVYYDGLEAPAFIGQESDDDKFLRIQVITPPVRYALNGNKLQIALHLAPPESELL